MPDVYHDFSGRDFTANFERLLTLLKAEVPEITDFNHSNSGIALMRLVAHSTDQLMFYLDEAFREGYITTANFMQSLIEIGATVDVLPKLAATAETDVTLTRVEGSGDDPHVLPRFTPLLRADSVSYLTTLDVTLPSGQDSITVPVKQGELVELTITPADWIVHERTGRPRFNLGANVAAYSVEVEHGDPAFAWIEIDSFWRSISTDRHFLLELYAEDYEGETNTVFLNLGDGTQGATAPAEDVTVRFIRTAGPDGNTGIGTVNEVPSEFVGLLTASNDASATGGAWAEGIENYRDRIPKVVRTQRRGVIVEDYEALVESISGVAHVEAIDRNHDNYWPHMYITIFVVPDGGGAISSGLRETIYSQLMSWGHFGAWRERYIVKDAVEKPQNVSLKIGIEAGYSQSAVTTAVQTAITEFFSPEKIGIHENIPFLDLYKTASNIAGVAWVDFDSQADLTAEIGEILTAGTISVTAS